MLKKETQHAKERLQQSIKEIEINPEDTVGDILGSSTGEAEYSAVSGGWSGTDDATSTSVDDQTGLSSGEELPIEKTFSQLDQDAQLEEEMELDQQAEAEELEELREKQSYLH